MANNVQLTDKEYVRNVLPERPVDANKGTMGTLISVTGSRGMAGAAIMSMKGALRSGVGLLKQVCVESIYHILASSVYEAVYILIKENESGSLPFYCADTILRESEKATALLIGCGCRNTADIQKIVAHLIKKSEIPLVIDADGLNALANNMNVLKDAKSEVILTPHPLEMSRLTGISVEQILQNREKAASDFTCEYDNTVLVLKGHDTLISKAGRLFMNPTGNPGMAKGGSGDVLSGIIASLCAQGVTPFDAAIAGVYVHGLAGDLLSREKGEISMLPGEIPDFLGKAYSEILK